MIDDLGGFKYHRNWSECIFFVVVLHFQTKSIKWYINFCYFFLQPPKIRCQKRVFPGPFFSRDWLFSCFETNRASTTKTETRAMAESKSTWEVRTSCMCPMQDKISKSIEKLILLLYFLFNVAYNPNSAMTTSASYIFVYACDLLRIMLSSFLV